MYFKDYIKILFFLSFVIVSCEKRNKLFKSISSDHSGIHFNNKIKETDSINILDFSNVYNGGGVGIGDFNKDGLEDIYFTGNMVENKLYLNKGNFKFEDVTGKSGVSGNGKWCRGVAVVDINNDDLEDMYVSASIHQQGSQRENLLYINTGNDKEGIPQFKEMAKEYGLNDTTHTTQSAFFDFDNDGDLDVYICVNEIIPNLYPNKFRTVLKDGSFPSTGRLYRNDWDSVSGHPVFRNVSKEAGVTIEGYGHSVTISDINLDGWKDIYVANDYLSSNILYINNGDGTFTDKVFSYLKHSSANAMGADIMDINNDGLSDIIELDMNPEDNFRKKTMMNAVSYQTYRNSDYFGYHYQYVRNTLQLNMGNTILQNDSIGDPVFAEIGFYSGIAETDWSWAPLVADFDNNSYRDIIVTNGFPKDITDHDFVAFRQETHLIATKQQLLEQIPEVKLHNYAFTNNGNLKFTDVSDHWGLTELSFSNGAAWADFDNDGDLDFVANNINDKAFLYENTLNQKKDSSHWLEVKLEGKSPNRDGFGTWIKLYYNNQQQAYEHYTVRGYLSSVSAGIHFGLGANDKIDSLIVIWPDNHSQSLYKITADKIIILKQADAKDSFNWQQQTTNQPPLFTETSEAIGIKYTHEERDYIDFNVQKLLPHKLSEYGPPLATGDINGDGLDDFIVGGSYGYSAKIFFQNEDGNFDSTDLQSGATQFSKTSEDIGNLLFDADSDGDMDLYIASGGYENQENTSHYQDRFYINDGKGNFSADTSAFPANYTSKSCVRACDFDKDGDLDLFVGGRVRPWKYPMPVSCFIYRNDSQNGKIKFTDVTAAVATNLIDIGLVCDALFTDFDNDGWPDLILAGEWMPVTFLKNQKGVFKNISASSGINHFTGWWTSITPGDFDNDGDIDYVIGNLGENTFYKANDKYPVSIYAKDFDKNGIIECMPTRYLKNSKGVLEEFTVHNRDEVIDQMPFIKKRFLTYKSFGEASFDQLFTDEEKKGMLKLQATYLQSAFIRNNGKGKFEISPLPGIAQISSLCGMITDDFDGDGNLDIAVSANDYGTDVSTGRYDASNGLLLKGKGDGTFTPLSILQSGIFIPGNGKALVKLRGKNDRYFIAASQNRGPLRLFVVKKNIRTIPLQTHDASAEVKYKNGISQKHEFYYGSSFLSQSSRYLVLGSEAENVNIIDSKGVSRKVSF